MPFSRGLRLCFYSFTIAQIISILGDRLHQFSVIGMIGKIAPGSSVELFQLGLFSYLPILVFAPLFGSLIDRSDKAMVLIVVDIIRGIIVLFVPAVYYLVGNLYAFYVPVLFLSLANLWFSPAKSAVLPEVFGKRYLLEMNAVLWGLGIVGTLGGFLLGGWLFDYHSWELSFYADGASYLVSVLFLFPLLAVAKRSRHESLSRMDTTDRSDYSPAGFVASIRQGMVLIRDNRAVASLLIVQMSLFASLGVLYVIGIARLQEVFPPDKTIYLSAVASTGTIGLLAGSGLSTLIRRRISVAPLIAGSTSLFGLSWIGVAQTSSLLPMVGWAFVMGLSVSPIFIVTETQLQVTTPGGFRGRVFSTREVLTKVAFLITSSIGTLVSTLADKGVILFVVGVFLAGLGVILLRKNFLKV